MISVNEIFICISDFGTILMIEKCFQSSLVSLCTISEFLFCELLLLLFC